MTDTATTASAEPPAQRGGGLRRSLLIGLPLGLLAGGAAFYAAYSGIMASPFEQETSAAPWQEDPQAAEAERPAFLPLDPMIIMLGPSAGGRHLRFRATLEVAPGSGDLVQAQIPRVLDVLNSYLRAVPIAEIESPSSLATLRSQMLRRVQLITGNGAVRDLLISEFVVN